MQLGQSPEEQAFAQWLLSVGEGTNQLHGGVECTMSPPDHVNISGRTAEGGLESLHATYQISLTLNQGHQDTLQRGQSLLLTMKQWMGSATAFLPSSLE